GPIVDACPVPIRDDDTAGNLAARAHDACLALLARVLARLSERGPSGLDGVEQRGPYLVADAALVEDLLTPRATDDDATLLRKLRAGCWDGETAIVLGAELPADAEGVAALRTLLR
ncbi:MAG TPA: hypothetical protein VLW53_20350, partial [Candidatus Eisenbacteria bacterium]|nr:hypothetical protein [Candidatus Eisenbacteria bacterium]